MSDAQKPEAAGMRCSACGTAMPQQPSAYCIGGMQSLGSLRCKCGCEQFSGTFTAYYSTPMWVEPSLVAANMATLDAAIAASGLDPKRSLR